MVAIVMVTFTMNSSSVEGDIDLDNLVALNTAQAEESEGTWCLTCTSDILYICYSDWVNGTYYGKFVSLVPGPCW